MFGGDFGLPPGPRYGRRSTGGAPPVAYLCLFTLAIELRVLVRVFPFQVIHSKAHETENGTRAPRRRRPKLYLFE